MSKPDDKTLLKQMLECQSMMADALQRSYKITTLLEGRVSTSPEAQRLKSIAITMAEKSRARKIKRHGKI